MHISIVFFLSTFSLHVIYKQTICEYAVHHSKKLNSLIVKKVESMHLCKEKLQPIVKYFW